MPLLIEIQHLVKSFTHEQVEEVILRDIDLTIQTG